MVTYNCISMVTYAIIILHDYINNIHVCFLSLNYLGACVAMVTYHSLLLSYLGACVYNGQLHPLTEVYRRHTHTYILLSLLLLVCEWRNTRYFNTRHGKRFSSLS